MSLFVVTDTKKEKKRKRTTKTKTRKRIRIRIFSTIKIGNKQPSNERHMWCVVYVNALYIQCIYNCMYIYIFILIQFFCKITLTTSFSSSLLLVEFCVFLHKIVFIILKHLFIDGW